MRKYTPYLLLGTGILGLLLAWISSAWLFPPIPFLAAAPSTETIIIPDNGFNHSIVYEHPVAFDSSGFAHIAIKNRQTEDMQYVRCYDLDCTSKTTVSVDNTNNTGLSNAIAVGSDGFARLVYDENPAGIIRFAQCLNTMCSSKTITTLGSGYPNNMAIQIAPDGYARIAYDAFPNNYFVQCTSHDCSTRITTNLGAGSTPSMILDQYGDGRLSYISATNELIYARCYTTTCSGKDTQILDTNVSTSSIARGGDGNIVISYKKLGGLNDLKFVHCHDVQCFNTSGLVTLDGDGIGGNSSNNVGYMNSIGIGFDGYARISYIDSSTSILKYIACRNYACTSKVITPINTLNTNPSIFQGMAVAPDGFSRIINYSISGSTGAQVTYIRCMNSTCGSNDDPLEPTVLFVNNTPPGAQSGLSNPTNLLAGAPIEYSAIHTDGDGDTATKYQLQISTEPEFVVSDFNTLPLFYDSGEAGTALSPVTSGTRNSASISPALPYAAQFTYYWRLRYFDSNGNIGKYSPTQHFTIPDTTNPFQQALPSGMRSGSTSEVTVGPDGFMRTATYDLSTETLSHVLCTDLLCTVPTITPITNILGIGEVHGPQLAVGTDGFSRIVYSNSDINHTVFVQCLNASCSARTTHSFPTQANVIRLALDSNDMARIMVAGVQHDTIKFISCSDLSCSTSTTHTLEQDHAPGGVITLGFSNYQNIALTIASDGFARMLFSDDTSPSQPYLIICGDATCDPLHANYSTTAIDTTARNFGTKMQLHMGPDGFPKIMLIGGGTLYYYQCSTANCAANPSTTHALGTITDLGDFHFGTDNFPRYAIGEGGSLVYTICTEATCTVSPQVHTLFSVPSNASLSFHLRPDQTPRFLTLTSPDYYPLYTYCSTPTCTGGANSAPAAPSDLYSNTSTNTAEFGLSNPTTLSGTDVVFSVIYEDTDSGDIATQYQLQIDDEDDFNLVDPSCDSGVVTFASLSLPNLTEGERSEDLSLPSCVLTKETPYYWRIKFWDDDSAEGAYSPDGVGVASFFIPDTDLPVLDSSVPNNGSGSVVQNVSLELTFSDLTSDLDLNTLDIDLQGNPVVSPGQVCASGYSCTFTPSPGGLHVLLNPNTDLALNTAYTVSYSLDDTAATPNTLTGNFTFTTANTPSAPTVLHANMSSLGTLNGEVNPMALKSQNIVVSGVHNDVDGFQAGMYHLLVAEDAGFSTVVYDSGSGGTVLSMVDSGDRSENISIPLTLNDEQTYYWKLRFHTIIGAGDYSTASFRISLNEPPTIPLDLYVNTASLGTSSGRVDPLDLDSMSLVTSAVFADPNGGDTATRYEYDIALDAGFLNIVHPSGVVILGTPLSIGSRLPEVTLPSTLDANTLYHIRFRFFDTKNIASPYVTTTFKIIDLEAPVLEPTTLPTANATDVSVNQQVVFTVTDLISAPVLSTFNVRLGGTQAILAGVCQSGFNCVLTPSGFSLATTITPTTPFAQGQLITTEIDVEDQAGNLLDTSFSFTTEGTPVTNAPGAGGGGSSSSSSSSSEGGETPRFTSLRPAAPTPEDTTEEEEVLPLEEVLEEETASGSTLTDLLETFTTEGLSDTGGGNGGSGRNGGGYGTFLRTLEETKKRVPIIAALTTEQAVKSDHVCDRIIKEIDNSFMMEEYGTSELIPWVKKQLGNGHSQDFITRAELVQILVLARCRDYYVGQISTAPFPDVPLQHEKVLYVQAAKLAGIIEGYEEGTFKPDQLVTRAEALKILLKTLRNGYLDHADLALPFIDVTEYDWFLPYVEFAFTHQITNDALTFRPHETVTRGELLLFLERSLANLDWNIWKKVE